MRIGKILTSAVLTASMLLSLLVGGMANAVNTPVALEQKAMLDPLSATEGVAYERHEAGYAVDLGREADSVTVNIAAPEAEGERAAWKARLYVDTGVELMRGVTYRVSYSLAALREQSAYDVHFDSSMAEDAYGVLYGRSVAAEGMDTVEYLLTPEAARGTLVLRLQLGMTGAEGNELRFANLKVEEASASAGNVLADQLNYGTQGNISIWTNEDSRAILVGGENSATLTVTEAPRFGAEVWKIKLLAATGLRPEAGKAYRVRADLTSTAAAEYEICYNEGDFEKGYDVQYAQQLTAGTQTIDRTIYIPTNRENAGELVLQFSLGKLAGGESVTISGIRVEEAIPTYTNVLSEDFAFDKSEKNVIRYYGNVETGAENITPELNWPSEESITVTGDKAGALSDVTTYSASLTINGGVNPWDARLNLHTGVTLEADKVYRVTLTVSAVNAYSNYEILYGNNFKPDAPVDNNEAYGALKGRVLAAETPDTVEYLLDTTGKVAGKLMISLFVGAVGGTGNSNKITVSNLKIEDMSEVSGYSAKVLSDFNFNSGDVWGVITAGGGLDAVFSKSGAAGSSHAQMTITSPAPYNDRAAIVLQPCYEQLTPGRSYRVKLDVWADKNVASGNDLAIRYGTAGTNHDTKVAYLDDFGETLTAGTPQTFTATFVPASDNKNLLITLECGKLDAGTTLTVSNLRVEELPVNGVAQDAVVTYFNRASDAEKLATGGSFEVRSTEYPAESGTWYNGWIYGSESEKSVTMVCWGNAADGADLAYLRGLFFGKTWTLTKDHLYKISFQIQTSASDQFQFGILNNRDGNWENEGSYGSLSATAAASPAWATTEYIIKASETGDLYPRLDFGYAVDNQTFTVKNIQVTELTALAADAAAWNGSTTLLHQAFDANVKTTVTAYWADGEGYRATLNREAASAKLGITEIPAAEADRADYKTKLYLRTGFTPASNKSYRVSFDIEGTTAQENFVSVFYGYGGGETEKIYGETDGQSVSTTVTAISQVVSGNGGNQPLEVQIRLGKVNAANAFTVSNLRIDELAYTTVQTGSRTEITNTVDNVVQAGYKTSLTCEKDSAALQILEVPAEGAEPWKAKLFIDTGVQPQPGETYRVTMDVSADKDQSFEICYNRDGDEKGYDAIYGLNVTAGGTKTVEKVFTAGNSGELIAQVSLGSATEPNTIRVSGLKVERVSYTNTDKSALPTPLSYRTQTAVDFWAHEDYTAALTGTADAATVNISKAPASGAEAWKAKLFVHTGAVLRAGGFYKVTANLSAAAAQDVDVCYNNADAEKGYGELNGVRIAKGETRTVEKLLYVSPTREDLKALTLQFNLGNAANQITVSGVKVEEVPVSLRDAMPKALNYSSAVRRQLDGGYASTIERAADTATLHLTRVPRSGAESWKAKLYVSTGARLAAGKTYLVTANVLASQTMDYELCFNAGQREKGYDALYGQRAEAGAVNRIERLITVPARGASGELILQFSVGSSPAANDITVSGVSVRELAPGAAKAAVKSDFSLAAVTVSEATENASGILTVSHKKLAYEMTKISAEAGENELAVIGAGLCAGETYAVSFTARADKGMTGEFALCRADGETVAILKSIPLSSAKQTYSFVTDGAIAESGMYELRWRFGSAQNQSLGSATVELSDIHLSIPAQQVSTVRSEDSVTVDGEEASASIYAIDGCNYFKLRDAAALLSGTKAQFGVQYVEDRNAVAITTGDAYEPVGGELTDTGDLSAQLMRTPQSVEVDGKETYLKAYGIGGYNYFRIRDLAAVLGFGVDYDGQTRTVVITSTKE